MEEIPNGIICPRCIPKTSTLETNFHDSEVLLFFLRVFLGVEWQPRPRSSLPLVVKEALHSL